MMPAHESVSSVCPTEANAAKVDRALLCIIRLSAFLCFAGWTWVHLYWEGPYGILVWQDATYEWASRWGISWDEFVGTGADDGFVQKWIGRTGWLYLGCTVLTLTVRKRSWIQMTALLGGSGLLIILSYAKYVAAQRQLPMFVEHGGQMLMPVLLVLATALGPRHRITMITAMIPLATTFAGHGCYALNLRPTPATFYAMICVTLPVEYETAQSLLRIAGVLDFLVCIAILIPPLRRPFAMYAVAWGFLTAIARPVAGMSWNLNHWGADQYLHEAVLRAPHYLIPLYLFLLWRDTEAPTLPAQQTPPALRTPSNSNDQEIT